MKIDELKQASVLLEALLKKYQFKEPEAQFCLSQLQPMFNEIKNSKTLQNYQNIPCNYEFHEGALRQYRELEDAYSEFCVLAKGLDPEEIKKLIDSL